MATNRPEYRDPKTPRAVKVYTIAQESRYLIVENVPALGLVENLLKLCSSFGPVQSHRLLDDHASATNYCDVVWIQFATTAAARIAKRTLDDKPFFSNLLRVSYAPEYETVDDLRGKLQERRYSVTQRVSYNKRKDRRQSKQKPPSSSSSYTEGTTTTTATMMPPVLGPLPKESPSTSSSSTTTTTTTTTNAPKKRRRI
ncbi:hypothetical protein O0I10_010147 [Lichtheimia ornata]|uniref:RNA-binding protein 48 n=1 Tax=Lichtheimia ornata TaxID=688661 RepID=A0AAD7XRL1_9FUNG|nr:uncharacterized protein O0I10_010147 [Lichtheimia ornata]KAJ8654199.1 hypothetical protein O0I10_010147 [Lichtheimia ornata]